jgi:hypothetical protein
MDKWRLAHIRRDAKAPIERRSSVVARIITLTRPVFKNGRVRTLDRI